MARLRAWIGIVAVMILAAIISPTMAYAASLQGIPGEPGPINLGEVDTYRRDGTLIDMKTCLAVVDDADVRNLLKHREVKAALGRPASERAWALRRIGENPRTRPGYGTLLACAQIVATWYTNPFLSEARDRQSAADSPRQPDDGRLEHGAVVIDLSFRPSNSTATEKRNRAFINPLALARLLTTPGLVPPKTYGGIVLKNAVIDGPLLLNNLRLTKPIAFTKVRFAGRGFNRGVFEVDERAPPTALAIRSAKIADQFRIVRSEFCGHAIIDDSSFEASLILRDVTQYAIGCLPRSNGSSAVSLQISESSFAQGISLSRSRFVATRIDGVSADSLASDRVDFGHTLTVEESEFDSLALECSVLASVTSINGNIVARNLKIRGNQISRRSRHPDGTCNGWWQVHDQGRIDRIVSLSVRDNRIGGGLDLRHFTGAHCVALSDRERAAFGASQDIENGCTPPGETASSEIAHQLRCPMPQRWDDAPVSLGTYAGACLRSPLILKGNHVGGGSDIILPGPDKKKGPWVADVDFLGSTYEGKLGVGLDLHHDTVELMPRTGFCPEIDNDDTPLTGTAIGMRAMRVRTLHWDLPLICDYRWLGYGLIYDLWLPGDLALVSLGEEAETAAPSRRDHLALKAWRRSLRQYDAPSLNVMSRYLADKGEFLDSREVLLEAKRLNYTPVCKPDDNAFSCGWQLAFSRSSAGDDDENGVAALGSAAFADQTIDDLKRPIEGRRADTDRIDRFRQFAMLFLLWPGGYGAEPERAILLTLGAVLVSYLIYTAYSLYQHWQVWRLPNLKPEDDESMQLAGSEERSTSGRGVDERPGAPYRVRFDHLLAIWPTEESWAGYSRKERLGRTREKLLPAIIACESEFEDNERGAAASVT